MIRKSKGEKVFTLFNYISLGLLAFTTLYPFLYTINLSLSTTTEAMRIGFHLYPREITLTSYNMVMKNQEILIGYGNTIYRTVFGTTIAILVTCMFAYPLARPNMPMKRTFTIMLIFTMLFSGGLIPNYLLMKNLGLINNRLVYLLPNMLTAFNVLIVRNYFKSIPESLYESAKLDGAKDLYILFKIIMPLSKPVLATVALWMAVGHWNSWFDGMLYITDNKKQILQIFLQRIVQGSQTELVTQGLANPDIMQFTSETVKSATIVVAILPILLVYPFIQKYFVTGIMLGSVKE